MINRHTTGLKGQLILAQGIRSDALGWGMDKRIFRAIMSINEKILFRTREMIFCFLEKMTCNSVRKGLLALLIKSSRTFILLYPLPRAAFRIVPPETMPWARISWAFSPKKSIEAIVLIFYPHQPLQSLNTLGTPHFSSLRTFPLT